MKFIGVALFVLFLASCFLGGLWLFGSGLAWLFAQFGVVRPWYVFAAGWFFFTLVVGVLRGSVKVTVK